MNKIKLLMKTLLVLAAVGQFAHAVTFEEVAYYFGPSTTDNYTLFHKNFSRSTGSYGARCAFHVNGWETCFRRDFCNECWRAARLKASPTDATFIEVSSQGEDRRAVFRMQEDGSWALVADDLYSVVLDCQHPDQAPDAQAGEEVHEEDSSMAQKVRAWLPYLAGGAIVAGVGGYLVYKMVSGGEQNPQEKHGDEEELLLAGA